MLVDRQNLIEETGLLNQQNEELKTLLNQYLQAGVNQELQVPPTQVIRLDIWQFKLQNAYFCILYACMIIWFVIFPLIEMKVTNFFLTF